MMTDRTTKPVFLKDGELGITGYHGHRSIKSSLHLQFLLKMWERKHKEDETEKVRQDLMFDPSKED